MKATIIIGAGLAGLAAARALRARGRETLVIEASSQVGGRVATTRHNGFLIDHGFQVILDSYPTLTRFAPPPSLAPRYFDSGALMWDRGEFFEIRSPLRHPTTLRKSAFSAAFSFADKVKFASLLAAVITIPDTELLAQCAREDDESTLRYVMRLGFSDRFVLRFLQPFFGGVFLDNDLSTSSGLFRYYLKKFATGRAFVPADGMSALPRALAEEAGTIHLGDSVVRVDGNDVVLASGARLAFDHLVLATDHSAAMRLLDEPDDSPWREVWTVSFMSDSSLYPDKLLVLPCGDQRLVRHFVQITNIAPSYAPPNKHLVVATILDPQGKADAQLAEAARREIADVFPVAANALSVLDVRKIPHALPAQPPGFARQRGPAAHGPIVFAGDHRTTGSLEGAVTSGIAAAQAIS